jgi:1-aminocyclopropane-1-carboxylate synthase
MFGLPSSLAIAAMSAILNHPTFLASFIKTSCERLVQRYDVCTSFLRAHNIPYIPSNAGHFLWADLSAFLKNLPGDTPLDKEQEMNNRLLDGGVHLATSEAFGGEESGWFRITFSVDEAYLTLGLNRYPPFRPVDRRMIKAIGAKKVNTHDGILFAKLKLVK